MSNHIHCILSAEKGNLSGVIRDLKSFTGKTIIDQIQKGPESRREWLLMISKYEAGGLARNKEFQIWTHDNHPEELFSHKFIRQKIDYLHMNPVKAGLVYEPQHWIYNIAALLIIARVSRWVVLGLVCWTCINSVATSYTIVRRRRSAHGRASAYAELCSTAL